MSDKHVTAVFGPQWVRDSVEFQNRELRTAEKVVLALRTWLRELDSSLPDPYDGPAWHEHEKEWNEALR